MGDAIDATPPEGPWPDVTAWCPVSRRPRRITQGRLVSLVRRGWLTLRGALQHHVPLPEGCWVPAPWRAMGRLDEDERAADTLTLPEAALRGLS